MQLPPLPPQVIAKYKQFHQKWKKKKKTPRKTKHNTDLGGLVRKMRKSLWSMGKKIPERSCACNSVVIWIYLAQRSGTIRRCGPIGGGIVSRGKLWRLTSFVSSTVYFSQSPAWSSRCEHSATVLPACHQLSWTARDQKLKKKLSSVSGLAHGVYHNN